jgi:pimeloyl-ACP methyl ester carboxylesterase
MKKSVLCRYILRASSILLLATSTLLAADALTKNSGINSSDTYLTFDETTIYQVMFDSSNSQNSSTPAPRSKKALGSSRERTFHVEEGYDIDGGLVLNTTFVSSVPISNPPVRRVTLSGGKLTFFDGNGAPVNGAIPGSNDAQPVLAPSTGRWAPLLKSLAIQDIRAYARATSAVLIGDPDSAIAPGSVQSVMLRLPVHVPGGGTLIRTFRQSSQGWVLAQETTSRQTPYGTMTTTKNYSNVLWHQNSANDVARKTAAHSRPNIPPHGEVERSSIALTSAGTLLSPSGCATTVNKLSGAQNVVFQHGIKGNSCSWNDSTFSMVGTLNQEFSFGTEIVPSLSSTDSLSSQSSALVSLLQTTGGSNYILIGHSQGGLISRSAAQYFQSHSPSTIKGVITVDTPNTGAYLALNSYSYLYAGVEALANKITDDVGNLLFPVGCSDPYAGPACAIATAIISNALAAATVYGATSALPATLDLVPGSGFLTNLNGQTENFVRVGIVSYSDQTWLLEHLGGDYVGGTNGGLAAVVASWAAWGSLQAGYLLYDEYSQTDCDPNNPDYDQQACDYDNNAMYAYDQVASDMSAVDIIWDSLVACTPTFCDLGSDGIVNSSSQYYPPPATVAQYVIGNAASGGADTHLASTKSGLVATALYTSLESNFFVPIQGCTYSLSPLGVTEPPSGGQGNVKITTAAGCLWSISSNVSWITFTPASGTGSATITYTIASDPSGDRSGTLVIAGQTIFSVTQQSVSDWWPAIQYLLR